MKKTFKDYDWYNDFVSNNHIPNYIDGDDNKKTISRKYVIDRLVEELNEDEVIKHCETDYHYVQRGLMTELNFNHYLVNVLRRVVRPQWTMWWY